MPAFRVAAAAGMLRAPDGGVGAGRGRTARIGGRFGASEERNLNFNLNLTRDLEAEASDSESQSVAVTGTRLRAGSDSESESDAAVTPAPPGPQAQWLRLAARHSDPGAMTWYRP